MAEKLYNVSYIPTKSIVTYTSFPLAAKGYSDLSYSFHFQKKNLRATTIHTPTDMTGYATQRMFRFFDQTIKMTAMWLYEESRLLI
jgi:hypothetical protein